MIELPNQSNTTLAPHWLLWSTKSLAFLFITNLRNHSIIFCQLWIKNYELIMDMTNNSFSFWHSHCIYIRAISFTVPSSSGPPIKTAAIKMNKDISLQNIIKRGWNDNMTDFLQTLNKLFSKKRKQINKQPKGKLRRNQLNKNYYHRF